MKEIKQEEKTCENCRYFLHHYVKHETKFFRIFNGHCINDEYDKKYKKKRTYDYIYKTACEFWEPVEIREAERKENILKTLSRMAEHINEMLIILKDEEKDA